MRPDVVGVVVTVEVVIVVCAGLGVRVVVLVVVVDVDGVDHVVDLAGRWAGRWTKWWRRWPGLKWRTVGVNLWLRRNNLRLRRWTFERRREDRRWEDRRRPRRGRQTVNIFINTWLRSCGDCSDVWTKWCCTKCWLRWWAHLRLWWVM